PQQWASIVRAMPLRLRPEVLMSPMVPAWLTSGLMLVCATLCYLVARETTRSTGHRCRIFRGLALGFVVLSMLEFPMIRQWVLLERGLTAGTFEAGTLAIGAIKTATLLVTVWALLSRLSAIYAERAVPGAT
ncbi:MAG TPA: hypothetical protein VG713_10265, partial [Pirellulales bacterium]|nr:hypothetical protein [Pirellulales bacterium]